VNLECALSKGDEKRGLTKLGLNLYALPRSPHFCSLPKLGIVELSSLSSPCGDGPAGFGGVIRVSPQSPLLLFRVRSSCASFGLLVILGHLSKNPLHWVQVLLFLEVEWTR